MDRRALDHPLEGGGRHGFGREFGPGGREGGRARRGDVRSAILGLLAEGLLATSIASRLRLSPRTVHKHLGNIYRKLGVHDRLVAVSLARLQGLVDNYPSSPSSPYPSSPSSPGREL